MLLSSTIFFSFLLHAVQAQLNCGPTTGKCGISQPCCSAFGICGSTPLHCGGGCQSPFSYTTDPSRASCYGDRPEIGKKCRSGRYDFSPSTTWIQNAEAYNGNYESADFVIYDYSPSTVTIGPSGGLTITINAPTTPGAPGRSARVSSTSYMLYGVFSIRLRAAPVGGLVTAFISMSDEKDEIDWEWTGGRDISVAQSNFFIKGNIDYTKSIKHPLNVSAALESHDYSIEWTADRITWSIDGFPVRTVTNHNINTPSLIQFSLWDGGAGAEGTREWAGGYVDWTASRTYQATFDYVSIQCQGDPVPTGSPVRASGLVQPTLSDKRLNNVIPSLPGYDGPGSGSSSGSNSGIPTGNRPVGSVNPSESSALPSWSSSVQLVALVTSFMFLLVV